MNPNEILNQLENAIIKLSELNEELEELSYKKNESEKEYKIEKAKTILILKSKNTPIGIIKEIAEGTESVAELEQKKKIDEDNYYITLLALDNLKKEIEVLRSVLTYTRAEYLNT